MEKDDLAKSSDTSIEKGGFISQLLSKDGISNQSLADDVLDYNEKFRSNSFIGFGTFFLAILLLSWGMA